jgi:hypothetical protein
MRRDAGTLLAATSIDCAAAALAASYDEDALARDLLAGNREVSNRMKNVTLSTGSWMSV